MLDLYLNVNCCYLTLQPVCVRRSVSNVLSDDGFRAEDPAALTAHGQLRLQHRVANATHPEIKLKHSTVVHFS